MKLKLSKSKLYSLLFTLMLFVGYQDCLIAQVQVTNITGCTITVYVGQNDLSTIAPCDLCPANPPAGTATTILNGQTVNIFGQDVCGEEASWIAWQVAGAVSFGLSPNPGLPATCVPTIAGAACFFGPTNAFWPAGGGTGFVSAIIF